MSHPHQEVLAARGAYRCVECGKCVALCPMAETSRPLFRSASPRGIVQQALQGLAVDDMPGLTRCLQCRSCSAVCPAGVDVAGLVADLRLAVAGWEETACAVCGAPLLPVEAARYLNRAVGADFAEALAYPALCPSCKRRAYIRNNS